MVVDRWKPPPPAEVVQGEAEPGVDLSSLPGPEVAAPAFLQLVDDTAVDSGRFLAQDFSPTLSGARS